MYFGVDYYPEHWIPPYGGTADHPEGCWLEDIALMKEAGFNVVRMGEFTWGLVEPIEGQYNFGWLRRVMDLMHEAGIRVILATPTAAPPLWLTRKHPEILPTDQAGQVLHAGTRRAVCLCSDAFWEYSRRIVTEMARALGDHPSLLAWQIDNAIGAHDTEESFNEASREEWHLWLKAKYETLERLNEALGLRHWGQVVSDWEEVPMPQRAPAPHNPGLVLDWRRFCSDTIVQYVRMQAQILREITPQAPVTTNLKPAVFRFDHFDLAEVLDFVGIQSAAVLRPRSAETALEIDLLRSLKKAEIRTPDGGVGFWVLEHKAGHVTWQDLNSLVRPGVLRLFTYQLISRGADAILFFRWRQPRFGPEQFHGAVMSHHRRKDYRVYREICQLGEEIKLLAPVIHGTRVVADVAIVFSHDNDWALQEPTHPNRYFHLREHIGLIYSALHDRNIPVEFARPGEDLTRYKLVFAPSLFLLSSAEAQVLKYYVENGGTLVGTCCTGLVDEHHVAPDDGYPHELIDLFGLEVVEFDALPPEAENHLSFKGGFQTSHLHTARIWCDIIEPKGCQILATYTKDFYAGKPAITMHSYGAGRAIYIGTLSGLAFYGDLVNWLRGLVGIHPLLKVPEAVEVSLRQKDDVKVYFLLNHHNQQVRVQFLKPMHDYLTGATLVGSYDLPPHGVLVLDERPVAKPA
ncbi:MAG: beta-galactosidase [Verrucomicrobiota bacterium]|nr:beta-galactosidase [Limisphaera sp.]MDW8381723.1 beta-galactosidase [Verrucomicrobiota bacterium]